MAKKMVALDANLLVLLVVGLTSLDYITTHKRLKAYTIDDYRLLTELLTKFSEIAVTPNVLSEASNLLRQIGEPARSRILLRFRSIIQNVSEIYIASVDAASREEFLRFGLADSAMLEVGRRDLVLLSSDAPLYLAALDADYEAENFNHYRNL